MPDSPQLDLERFAATPLARDPFDHVIVPGFLPDAVCDEIDASFPKIDKGGSFPADSVTCGPRFLRFLEDLEGDALRQAVERKFGIDLAGRPTMVTLRGQSRAKDGRVHTDSESKLITALIFMNAAWDADGGRLRLLLPVCVYLLASLAFHGFGYQGVKIPWSDARLLDRQDVTPKRSQCGFTANGRDKLVPIAVPSVKDHPLRRVSSQGDRCSLLSTL